MTLLLVYLFLALGVSFLCSLLEASLLSLPPSHVRMLADSGNRAGQRLAVMKQNVDRPLAAILTLNTVAHTFGAAGVGAQAALLFGTAWVGLISVVVTILILFLSEIVPKTLGAVYAKRLAPFTAYTTVGLIYATYPLVRVSEWVSRLVSGTSEAHLVTREEVITIAEMGQQGGVLSADETRAISNLIRLREVLVQDIMTPRPVVFALPETITIAQAVGDGRSLPFSRIPVYAGDLDHITGIVHRYQLYKAHHNGRHAKTLAEIAAPMHAVPEVASVARLLEQFIERRQQLFQVVDEYGGTAGVVSLEDALETLLGVEIMDETDAVADLRELARRRLDRHRAIAEDKHRFANRASAEGPATPAE